MKKTAIAPIIAVIALGIGTVTGHVIDSNTQDLIATITAVVVTSGLSIWGIIKDHKKSVK